MSRDTSQDSTQPLVDQFYAELMRFTYSLERYHRICWQDPDPIADLKRELRYIAEKAKSTA